MTDATPYIVPKERGNWRALTLAALVHLALLAFLWIGVRWQNETPATIEAEVWNPVPREAAALPEPPKAEPEPKPEPKPVVQEPPKPKVEEPPVVKPDIALAQEKKRKEEEKKRREEEERQKEKKKLEEKKRLEEEQKLAKLKQQEDAKRLEKEKADKKRKQEEADAKLLAKLREEDMKRITGGVTGTGGSGEAKQAQGGRASADYLGRIAGKIRSNINFIPPETLQGNPPVEFEVKLLPDGSVASLRKLRSSGVPGFDEAVERAINRSAPFPRDANGTVPGSFIGSHRPKDQ